MNGPVFANVTNHAVAEWSPSQRAACEELGGGIVDVPFPHVPPEAGTAEIAAMASDLAQRVVETGAAHALVQGEFTLVLATVRELRMRGVRCWAATTTREVEVTGGADGASIKRSVYRFVRLREYL